MHTNATVDVRGHNTSIYDSKLCWPPSCRVLDGEYKYEVRRCQSNRNETGCSQTDKIISTIISAIYTLLQFSASK